MRRIRSLGMPALIIDLAICSLVSCRLLISGSAISIANRESRVRSFSISSLVFLCPIKVSTMLVPAEPSPINCTLFWYIRVVYHIPTNLFNLSLTDSRLDDIDLSIFDALSVKPSKSLIWSSTTSWK
jgi:hypothetical protein